MLTTPSEGAVFSWLNISASDDRENETGASANEHQQLSNSTAGETQAILSSEHYRKATMVVECGILPTMGLLGIITNTINMVVYYRMGLRDKMNFCLFALASVDFMFVFVMFLTAFHCPAVLFPDSIFVLILKWQVHKFTLNFWYAFWYSSGVITVIIATERCICVVWPLKAATIFTTKRMACLIVSVVVILNLLCMLYALKHVVRVITDENGNVTVIYDNTDLYYENKLAFLIVRDGLLSCINFTTFFVIAFVTVVTVKKLRTAMDWRQKTSGNVMDKRQITLVKILITISCVYIACNIPKLSLAAVRFLVEDFSTVGRYKNLFFITNRGGFGPLMLNSSVNVFIYYRQSVRFRKELQACMCCIKDSTGKTPNA